MNTNTNVVSLNASKTARRADKKSAPKTPRKVKPKADLSVMGQIFLALRRENLSATVVGFLLGGLVPLASYMVVHYQLDLTRPLYMQPLMLMVIGGLLFSAKTVYEWTTLAFESKAKALGFVVLVEGILTMSSQEWLAIVALAYLVAVNGVATGVKLALSKKA